MAGKNRVGSLYMELVLDPSKYAKGASQAVKDHRRMQKELNKAHNGMDPRDKARADLEAAKKAAKQAAKLAAVEPKKTKKTKVNPNPSNLILTRNLKNVITPSVRYRC